MVPAWVEEARMRLAIVAISVWMVLAQSVAAQSLVPSYPTEARFDVRRDFDAEVRNIEDAIRLIDPEIETGTYDVVLCNRSRGPGSYLTVLSSGWKEIKAGRCVMLQGISDLRVAPEESGANWSGNAYIRMR
jgi:hypothetical protein